MSLSEIKGINVPVKIWSPLEEVESEALTQLRNVSALPWVFHHVAAMPDLHAGKGCTVGSVVATKNALSPSTVGVDIGCGMAALKTNLKAFQLPDSLKAIRSQLERDVPVGFNYHDHPVKFIDDYPLWKDFDKLDAKVQNLLGKARKQLGTLGGGNHFIELCLDSDVCEACAGSGTGLMRFPHGQEVANCPCCDGSGKQEPNVWLMLHSGSRNIGKELAEIHISIAKKLIHNKDLPDPDLASFLSGTEEMKNYRKDLYWAQQYARFNRDAMLTLCRKALERFFPDITFEPSITCHHNYVSEECHFGENVFVTRKGAINAEKGTMGIIPGSMSTGSYIVRGLGNPESFNSASHGAGRKMSRSKAKKLFTVEDVIRETEGIECRKDSGIIDEISLAYKDIKSVMDNQKDLVEIVTVLKQVLCIKG